MNVNKIIAYKNNRVVKISAQLTDKLNFNLLESYKRNFLSSDDIAYKIFKHFNEISWSSKSVRILNLNNPTQELQNDETKKIMKKSLYNYINELEENEYDLGFTNQEFYYLERDYECSQIDLIEQLGFFNNMPIPTRTIDFIEGYINQIEEISFSRQQLRKLYIENTAPMEEVQEYVMYVGPNANFKGFIGKIVQHRVDSPAHLVEFYAAKPNGKNYKFWSMEQNLIRFYF